MNAIPALMPEMPDTAMTVYNAWRAINECVKVTCSRCNYLNLVASQALLVAMIGHNRIAIGDLYRLGLSPSMRRVLTSMGRMSH